MDNIHGLYQWNRSSRVQWQLPMNIKSFSGERVGKKHSPLYFLQTCCHDLVTHFEEMKTGMETSVLSSNKRVRNGRTSPCHISMLVGPHLCIQELHFLLSISLLPFFQCTSTPSSKTKQSKETTLHSNIDLNANYHGNSQSLKYLK